MIINWTRSNALAFQRRAAQLFVFLVKSFFNGSRLSEIKMAGAFVPRGVINPH